jgi:hypothetical protein
MGMVKNPSFIWPPMNADERRSTQDRNRQDSQDWQNLHFRPSRAWERIQFGYDGSAKSSPWFREPKFAPDDCQIRACIIMARTLHAYLCPSVFICGSICFPWRSSRLGG